MKLPAILFLLLAGILIGLGRLLALSPRQELNVLAVHRYRREFGDSQLFVLHA
jgi:hypothetical protein